MQISVNPAEEKPSALRALAHMLNCLAADRDVVRSPYVSVSGPEDVTITATVEQNPGNAPAVPGASDQSSDGQSTDAPAGSSTSLDWSELDANKLPWNGLIHSSSKNRNADGTWRYLRGGDAAERARVEAEMREQAPATAGKEDTPPPPPVVKSEGTPPPPPPPVAGNGAPPPPPPVATPQAASDSEGHEVTPAMVFKRANALTKEQREQALELVGLTAMGDFLKKQKEDPSLVQGLWDAMIAITGEE